MIKEEHKYLMAKHFKTNSGEPNNRVEWLDIAKAYGIIAIVLGHILTGSSTAHFLYWWHIPLFFLIAGIFLKPLKSTDAWSTFFKKRVISELLMYTGIGLLLICLYTVIHHQSNQFLMKHLFDLVLGGRTLNFYTSTFWFINVYLLTIMTVTVLISVTKNWLIVLLITIVGLFLGTGYQQVTWMHINGFAMMPWGMDTVLITAFYTYLGYLLFHGHLKWLQKAVINLPIMMLAVLVIYIHSKGNFSFRLSLKSHLMQSSLPIGLAVAVIPVIFSLAIMVCAYFTSKIPTKFWLPIIGRHTLAIMYGHKLFLDLCLLIGIRSLPVRLAIGIIAPVMIALIVQKVGKSIFEIGQGNAFL
ncbi:acyltransferase family protein [Lentilactobacillus hilgardii]|uniref:acyltransferase family protein n=1 Tax=Lentilactobacillus hilgardii TaxID=1588 RepID=UPI00390CC3C0